MRSSTKIKRPKPRRHREYREQEQREAAQREGKAEAPAQADKAQGQAQGPHRVKRTGLPPWVFWFMLAGVVSELAMILLVILKRI